MAGFSIAIVAGFSVDINTMIFPIIPIALKVV